ncbi:MAG: DUF4139 domain-containing protein [Pseudomonadota bacterium]
MVDSRVRATAGLMMACAAASVGAETAITIYSKASPGAVDPRLYRPGVGGSGYFGQSLPGYAIVRDQRSMTLQAGRGQYARDDVAALIDPTTVRFESLTDPEGTRVLEQDFRFDLVDRDKLLERYLDREVVVTQRQGDDVRERRGTLLSTRGGMVLQDGDGSVDVLSDWNHVALGELPGGLMTRPTLVWDLAAERGGAHDTRVSYETAGITWWADYNLVWAPKGNGDTGTLGVGAWVSIVNQSGASYEDAKLKLVAGDVQRVTASASPRARNMVVESAFVDAAGFEEKAFFEFHLYTLGRETTLPNNATKQIELFPQAAGVPAEKQLVYYGFPDGRFAGQGIVDRGFGMQSNPKVDVYLEFENRKRDGLGIPLPAGRLRVSQLDDADGTLEFIGEDVIGHTARNEPVRVRLGSAFDVTGERKQVDYAIDSRARWIEETLEITLTNRKDAAQRVTVAESLYRYANWEISGESDDFEKIDSRTIHFDVRVPADGKKTVRYKVRYTW